MPNRKLLLKFLAAGLVICVLLVIVSFIFLLQNSRNNVQKPDIVELFACSDYCPEPESEYLVKVYEGVSTEEECNKYDGKFKSFTGWGTTYYCEVK